MSGPWEQFQTEEAGPWSQFSGATPPEKQSAFRQIADVPLGIAKGVAQGVRMLSDVFGAGSGVSTAIKGVETYVSDLMSAQAKQDREEIARIMKDAEDKGILDQVQAGLKAISVAPIDTITSALGTAVPAIAAGLGAATFGAPAAAITGAGALIGAGMGAGTIKGSIYEETKTALKELGASEQEAEQKAQLAQSYGGKNLDQILLGTVIGGVAAAGPLEKGTAGMLARRILGKAAAVDTGEAVAKEAGEAAVKGALRQRAEAGVLEALPEALQAGQEQVAQNIALQREGMDVPTFRGAVSAATLEGLAGAGLGAAVGRAAPVETLPPAAEAPVAEAPVVPEAPVSPEAQVQPRVEDITGVSREAPPSAEDAAETFARMYSMGDEEGRAYADRVTQDRILRQQQAIDADAERIAELNRRQGITSPETPVSPIEERPSIAEAQPELTSREDLLAKQAEIDQRRLEAGLPTGQTSLTPGVEPTAPIVEEPQPVPKIVDNRPLTEKAAANRLLVMRNMLQNQGGDPNSLTVVPHPSVPSKFAIQSLDVPVKFTKNLPATAIDRPVTPTIIDPVNAYVEVQRRTNTPAARRFVSDFEAGNITREDVQSAISVERKAAEPPLAVLPKGEIVSAPTSKTRAEPTSFQIDLKQKAEGNEPFAIVQFPKDGRNVYYASPVKTLEANERTELALTQREQTTADAVQAMLDASTTQGERTASELALQSALRRATVRALADVKVPEILPPKPTVTEEVSPPPTSIDTTQPVALPKSLDEFKDRLPSVWDKADVRKANEAGDFKQLVASLQAGSNPVIRRIGEMAQGLGNKIRLDKPGKLKKSTWAGQFSWGPSGESIKLRPDHAGNEEVNAHEMVHALTISVQRNPVTDKQRQYVAKIKDLYNYVTREFNKKGITAYGLQDEFEFTAEAMTNPKFQYELMQLPYPGKKSAWSQFVKTVADLLGITNTNALTEIMTLVEKVSQTKAPRKKVTGVYTIGSEIEGAPRKSLVAQRSKLGLYSELENKVQAGSPKAPAASWKAYINGLTQKGVKPEEIEWSGVRDWLDLQKGTVLKEDLLNYLKEGGVQVEETVLGAQGFTQAMQNRLDELENNNDRTDAEDAERQRLISAENAASDVRGEVNQTKFGQYTLPGGENYREVLLTVPTAQKLPSYKEVKEFAKQWVQQEFDREGTKFADSQRYVDGIKDDIFSWSELWSEAAIKHFGLKNTGKIRGGSGTVDIEAKNVYQSNHWDQPNVLAHIRLNDRTDADGKKVLFVEEIQSDWGQEGKKRGFAGKPTGKNAEYQRLLKQFESNTLPDSEYDHFYELQDELGGGIAAEQQGSIPAAPFVGKTEGWLNLALKRIMVMASEEGYDRVAFVNGVQSAERYDLSKSIDSIDAQRRGSGTYDIDVATKEGKDFNRTALTPAELEDHVGKEMAQKIIDATAENQKPVRFSGLDLKVGGEGMKTFYDTIVPTALKKLLPKVGGTQLQPVEIYQQGIVGKKLPADAKPAAMRDGRLFTQPGFDVTPEMQEKVATTGLPMFSKKGERTQQLQEFQQTLRAQLNKFGLTDVGLKIEAGMKNAGSYAQQLIRIANDSAKPIQTLRHEAIHALRQLGFFTDSQWKSLSKMAQDKWIDQYLKQRNVDGKPLKAGEESRYDAYMREYKGDMEKITEEAVSDAFGDFDATKPPAGLIQAILKRLQNLFQSIQTALTKVESPEQIFGKVEKGELKAGARETATESKSLREKATETFKRWFKNSKVTDDDGQPKVMYHATTGDFTEFKPGGKDETISGPAIWLSPYADTQPAAHNVGGRKGQFREGTNVMPVYVRMERPLVIDDMTMLEWARSVYGDSEFPQLISKKAVADMKEDGYDGIQFDGEALGWGGRSNETIVFDANQIKSAIGNNGEYSLTEADIRKSLGGKKEAKPTIGEKLRAAGQEAYQKRKPLDTGAFKGVPEDLVNGLGKVFAPKNETILDRIDGMKDNFWQRVAQGVADQYRSIKEYSEDAYMKARMSKTIDGGLEGLMFHGQVFNDGGALNIRKNTKGLLEVLKPVGKELDRYLIWVALSRDSTMPEGKRSISDDLVSRRNELIQGTIDGQSRLEVYQKIQKEMNALNRSVLKVAVDAGLLNTTEGAIKDIQANDKLTDQEKAEKIAELRANPIGYERFINDLNYIPFYKVMEEGDTQNVSTASGLTSQYFSKALKGGEKPFGDLMENTLRNWSHILSASMKNQAAEATIEAAVKHNAATPNLKDGLEMRGGKVYSTQSDKMVGDGSLRPEFTKNDTGAVKVMMDGQPTYYMVTDPLLLDAISAIGYMGPKSKFLDVAKDFKNLLQFGVTISPTFKVNNLIRDSVSAMGVSELRKDPVSNVMQGISLADKNNETYIAALSGGAIFNFGSAYEGDQSRLIKRLVKQGAERDSILDTKQRIAKGLRASFDKYQEWGNKSESANRLALYKQLRDKGMSHLEASFKARDLLDFSMQGSWPAFRILTQVIPFLNARIQGLYKLGRDGIAPTYRVLYNSATGKEIIASDKQKAESFMIVTTAVGLASAALYLAFKDDEDYKKRDDWDRDNFWWIKLPGMDSALRIPKPFEIGAFGTLVERTLEQIYDSGAEGKQFTDSLSRTLSNTFALNPIPQVIKPLYDIYANKDSFTGAPIESAGLEKLSKQERQIDTTSPLAIALGGVTSILPESMELSPVQVDYMIKGYFGWLGGTAASISIGAVAPFKDGEYPDTRWMDKASLGLVKQLPSPQSKYVTAFYESNKEISQAFADMRHYQTIGDTQKAMEILEEKGDLIALSKMYDRVAKDMGSIRTQIRIVTNDPEMSGAAKQEAIERMKMMLGLMAQQAEELRKSRKP